MKKAEKVELKVPINRPRREIMAISMKPISAKEKSQVLKTKKHLINNYLEGTIYNKKSALEKTDWVKNRKNYLLLEKNAKTLAPNPTVKLINKMFLKLNDSALKAKD